MKAVNRNKANEKGFTLVELAVGMVVIGLLLGGLLKSQEMLHTASISATIAQFKEIQSATLGFREKYSAMPGDMLNPGARIPGCATPDCAPDPTQTPLGNGLIDSNTNGFVASFTYEYRAYWLQLAAANFITGINPNQGIAWGGFFPEARVGGGFHVAFADIIADLPTSAPLDFSAGHYLAIQLNPFGSLFGPGPANGIDISMIDTKIDNGLPRTGKVYAGQGDGVGCMQTGLPNVYIQNFDRRTCRVYFYFVP